VTRLVNTTPSVAADSADVSSFRRAVLASNLRLAAGSTDATQRLSAAGQHGPHRRRPAAGALLVARDGSYLPERRRRRTTRAAIPSNINTSKQSADTPATAISAGSRDVIDDVTAALRNVLVGDRAAPVVEFTSGFEFTSGSTRDRRSAIELVEFTSRFEFISGSALNRKSAVELSAKDVVAVPAAGEVSGSGIMG